MAMADLISGVKQANQNERISDQHNVNGTKSLKITPCGQRKTSTVSDTSCDAVDTKRRTSVESQPREFRRRMTFRGLTFSLIGLSGIQKRDQMKPKTQIENTYRTQPISGTQFLESKVKRVATSILEQQLEGISYNPKDCAKLSIQLAQIIRDRLKLMNFPRHKIVCNVMIGQDKNQGLEVASLCLWNTNTDSFTSVSYKTKDLFAIAIVHAIYFE